MSRNSKPRYVLLEFEEDKKTMVKRTDVVEWLDYSKTHGKAVVDGNTYLAKSFFQRYALVCSNLIG
jgi:hypothetical protein